MEASHRGGREGSYLFLITRGLSVRKPKLLTGTARSSDEGPILSELDQVKHAACSHVRSGTDRTEFYCMQLLSCCCQAVALLSAADRGTGRLGSIDELGQDDSPSNR